MNTQRPKNLNLATISFPVTAITSILHRITGVFLVIGIPILLWLLSKSIASPSGFAEANDFINSAFGSFVFWAILTAIAYHIIAGIRHLIMDAGVGETLEGGMLGSKIILVLSVIAAIALGVWVW